MLLCWNFLTIKNYIYMKKLNYFLVISLVGLSVFFTSCERENETHRDVIITFENVELGEQGYQNHFPDGLILSDVDFYNHFYQSEQGWSFWEGFAVSRLTDRATVGMENQFSVYASSGAGGSAQFAVVYAGFLETTNARFLDGQEFQFRSLMINNTTWAVHALRDGSPPARAFRAGDWFKIIITGFDARGNETGKVEFYLADFRNGRSFILQEWARVDLTSLGEVNKLEFTFDSTDVGDWGVNTPTYAAIDNIIYKVPLFN